MPYLASHPGFCRHGSGNEVYSPRPRLEVHGDFALVPLSPAHRGHSNRSLAQYINDDNALDKRCALQHRSFLSGFEDAAAIDRNGPFVYPSCAPRCRSHPRLCDDYYPGAPDSNRRFPHTYPLQCMEPGAVRWSPDQIQAYNRDVLRYNNQIARRRDGSVPGEYMMLHPMMDPLGRFPPGFDRPLRLQDFFSMDGEQRSYLLPKRIFSTPSHLSTPSILSPEAIHLHPLLTHHPPTLPPPSLTSISIRTPPRHSTPTLQPPRPTNPSTPHPAPQQHRAPPLPRPQTATTPTTPRRHPPRRTPLPPTPRHPAAAAAAACSPRPPPPTKPSPRPGPRLRRSLCPSPVARMRRHGPARSDDRLRRWR
jgi:hypothetical protein